jgi:glycosyltransferase involved in cell wall biosynthesis
MAPTRILYVIGGGEFGGAEQHLIGLVKTLNPAEWLPHIAVFYEGEFAERLRQLQIPVTVLTPTDLASLGGMTALRQLIRQFQPAILHTHGVRANLLGRLANKAEGFPAKLVTTVHSVLKLDYPKFWKRFLFERFERWTWRYVDRFILVSRAMKQDFLNNGLPEGRVTVIHNAIQLPEQPPVRPEFSNLRDELGLPQETVLVGTVARLHPVKGHTYLIQAVKQLETKYPAVHYVWIGGGDLQRQLKEEVEQAGLTNRILFLGVRQDVPELLPQLDLFVLPSISEGLSVAILEALLAGVPVVTTAVGGSPEVVDEGRDGLLVPAKNPDALSRAIEQALSDPEARKQMGQEGQQKVYREFSLERLVRETTDLYKGLLAESLIQTEKSH